MEIVYLTYKKSSVEFTPKAKTFIEGLVDDLFKEHPEMEQQLSNEVYKAVVRLNVNPKPEDERQDGEMEVMPVLEISVPENQINCRSKKYGVVALGRKYYGKKIWLIRWLYAKRDGDNFIVCKRNHNQHGCVFVENEPEQ